MFKVDLVEDALALPTDRGRNPFTPHLAGGPVRVACLFSGGKDSAYAAYVAMQRGWEVAALITLRPEDPESMMFHVPNLAVTALQAEAMEVPIFQEPAKAGESGELEALRRAFRRVPAEGLVVGAIASDYQHSRVNRAAHDAGLRVFAPLWRHDPVVLVRDYLHAGLEILFSSVSAEGLDRTWLGRTWDEGVVRELLQLHETLGVHPCGEGGEFETLVLDAPFFRRRVVVDRSEASWDGRAGTWRVLEAHLEDKREPRDGREASGAGPI